MLAAALVIIWSLMERRLLTRPILTKTSLMFGTVQAEETVRFEVSVRVLRSAAGDDTLMSVDFALKQIKFSRSG